MRTIKFRGKKMIDDKAWVYGYYVVDAEGIPYISCPNDDVWMVDPRTVGQFTGLLDSKGVEIYEGDMVIKRNGVLGKIYFENGSFIIDYTVIAILGSSLAETLEVIGNIHERSET